MSQASSAPRRRGGQEPGALDTDGLGAERGLSVKLFWENGKGETVEFS